MIKMTLYLIVCAAPPAEHIQDFIRCAQKQKWEICVIATPQAIKFMNVDEIETLTSHPVRSEYKMPGSEDILPKPDAIAVIPATFNTINKWALGISDTLALGLLCEALGAKLPIVVAPCLKDALAKHPAFDKSIKLLRKHSVQILYEPTVYLSPQIVPYEKVLSKLDEVTLQHEKPRADPTKKRPIKTRRKRLARA